MKRWSFYLAPALICACMYAIAAHAGVMIMPPPGPARIANADAVIVGKVESIEPADIKIGNTNYRIAIVKINDGVRGVKDEKSLRVGFIPQEKPNPKIRIGGIRHVQLAAGQEGLFILKKQEKETFYTLGGIAGYYINSENNPGFEKEVQIAKAAAKVLENPQASLKAKDADERMLAAAILIDKYRNFRGPNSKQEPIDAQESKLILQALVDADWKSQANFTSLRPAPWQLFQRLGVTAQDGYAPQPKANYHEVMQTWLRENAEKYRIQRLVAGDAK
jgi:hypothetical protein